MSVILVTGSTGFIGAHLCRMLCAQGHQVRAFHRQTSRLFLLEGLPMMHVIGDLTRPESLMDPFSGIEYVFHLAATSRGLEKPGQMYTINVEGTRNILKAAFQAGVKRVVYISSISSLGLPEMPPFADGSPVLLDESHSWNTLSNVWPFGYSKYLAELEVQKMVGSGLDAVIVNPTLVFGAGDLNRQSSSIIVQSALSKIPFSTGGGLNIIHVDDLINGILSAMEYGKKGERYILGNENMTYSQLSQVCAQITGIEPPDAQIAPHLLRKMSGPLSFLQPYISSPLPLSYLRLAGYFFYFNNQKAIGQLGWKPQLSAYQAILDAYNWFKEQGTIQMI